jgi:hypothetical protein
MQVTVAVTLDDGTEIKRTVEVRSSDNPRFWTHGIQEGAETVTASVRRMVEAEYGISDSVGIHVVR